MVEMKAQYLGGLQVECEHLKSGAKLKTSPQAGQPEAGAAFSPTGLCASALAACVLTMMGAYAEKSAWISKAQKWKSPFPWQKNPTG